MVKRILGNYLLVCSIFFMGFIPYKIGIHYILSSFYIFLFFLAIISFFIYSGYIAIFKEGIKSYTYIQISFLIQSFQFSILGIDFKNYFGPFVGVGFSDTPYFEVIYGAKFFWYNFTNGYRSNSNEIIVVINLVPLLFYYLLNKESNSTENVSEIDINEIGKEDR